MYSPGYLQGSVSSQPTNTSMLSSTLPSNSYGVQPSINDNLRKACMGKAQSSGGLGVIDFKNELIKYFPQDRDVILASRRKDLHQYCSALLQYQQQVELQQSQSPMYTGGMYNTSTGGYNPGIPYDPQSSFVSPGIGIMYTPTRVSSSDASSQLSQSEEKGTFYTDKNKRWCRCNAHVAAKGNIDNPYALCTHSVGRDGRVSCEDYYRNEYHLPDNELHALADLKGKTYEEYRALLGYN